MSILLNDAYETLKDEKTRKAYDDTLRAAQASPNGASTGFSAADALYAWEVEDLDKPKPPTWKRAKREKKEQEPVWQSVPRSMSAWDKVEHEGRAEKWVMQQMVFIDEWTCIGCRNCLEVAPYIFGINNDTGRARVFNQWGHPEDWIEYAVQACPVECIHWVSRTELQMLEHITARELYRSGDQMACSMSMLQGVLPDSAANYVDPFSKAKAFRTELENEAKARRRKAEAAGFGRRQESQDHGDLRQRIQGSFRKLSQDVQQRGWGMVA